MAWCRPSKVCSLLRCQWNCTSSSRLPLQVMLAPGSTFTCE